MPEWIERETAYEMINEAMTAGIVNVYTAEQRRTDFEEALEAIEAVPTAGVEPVRHGEWKICCDGYYPYCSVCKDGFGGIGMNNKEIMEKISELEQQIAELKTVKNIGILHHTESM